MALVACPECKKEVSTFAESCPHCGLSVAVVERMITEDEIRRRDARLLQEYEQYNKEQLPVLYAVIVIGVFAVIFLLIQSQR